MSLLFWWFLSAIVLGGCIYVTIRGLITREKIRQHLDREERNKGKKLAGLLNKLRPNGVSITLLDQWGDKEGEVEYQSEDGVSSLLRIGDRI